MDIGIHVRGLVDGMWEAVEVTYLTLIKEKKKRLFDFTKKNINLLHIIYYIILFCETNFISQKKL